MSHINGLDDRLLKEITDYVVNTVNLSADKAIQHFDQPNSHPMSSSNNTLEEIFYKRLIQLPTSKQQSMVNTLRNITPQMRESKYGRLAGVNLRSDLSVTEQARALSESRDISLDQLPLPKMALLPEQTTGFEGIRFRVHRVECIEETDEIGADHIQMSGISIDSVGIAKKINIFTVSDDFDAGENKIYSPPKNLKSFNFPDIVTLNGSRDPLYWPRSFAVIVVLAEHDDVGFSEFVVKLLEEIKPLIEEKIATWVTATILGATIGGSIGNTFPGLGTLLGAAIGAIVGAIVGALITLIQDWFLGQNKDEIFDAKVVELQLPTPYSTWNGVTNTKNKYLAWQGDQADGGRYKLLYDWEVFGEKPLTNLMVPPNVGAVAWKRPLALGLPGHEASIERIDVFMRGMDRRMYQTWISNNSFIGWTPRGSHATFSSGAATSSWNNDRLDVFALGDDNRIWQCTWENSEWTDWEHLGDNYSMYGPATVATAENRLKVFYVDLLTRHMRYLQWNGSEWSMLESNISDGEFISTPAATFWDKDRLHVFALGDDRKIYHASLEENIWSSWSTGPGEGTFVSAPAAVSWVAGRIDVFALGEDHKMYHSFFDGFKWSGWSADTDNGIGKFLSGPAAVSKRTNSIDLFAVGYDKRLWHNTWRGSSWSGWSDDMACDAIFS